MKALSWCPWDASQIATGGGISDRRIIFWDVNNGNKFKEIETGSQVLSIVYSVLLLTLLVTSITYFFTSDKSILYILKVSGIIWNENYREILSSHGFSANTLYIWNYATLQKLANLQREHLYFKLLYFVC